MDVRQVNAALSRGAVDAPGVLPHAEQLAAQPFVFGFDFGLDTLPPEPGVILVRGLRQYGKSTWLELELGRTVREYGPGSAYYLNGDEIRDSGELQTRIRECVGLFAPKAGVRRLFVDEITAIRDWQAAIKRLVDAGELRDILVVTTGSKALDLRRGTERLPGRKGRIGRTLFRFTPVSFGEFERVCGPVLGEETLASYIVAGGSPPACARIAREGHVPVYIHESVRDWVTGEIAAAGRSRIALLSVMEVLHRFGGTPVGQAKLAREAGLANNTVAAGYVELLTDLMVAAPCLAWDVSRRIPVARRPCKYHFTNLLVAACWSPNRPRTAQDLLALPEAARGKWREWVVAQELFRRRRIAGKEVPELLLFWGSKEHEIDFVAGPSDFLEVKPGATNPTDFSWFESVHPRSRLLVVGDSVYESRSVRGVRLEDYLRGA